MRRIMKGCVFIFSLIMIFGISGCGDDVDNTYNYYTQEPEEEALHEGMPQVVVVSGSDYEMGYQCAQQIAPLIWDNHVLTWGALVATYGEEAVLKDAQVWAYYWYEYDPSFKDWVEGMSDGCKEQGYDLSPLEILMISLYPTTMWGRPPGPYPPETGVQGVAQVSADSVDAAEKHSCTSFSATGTATTDGNPVVAVTKMVPMETMQCFILVAFPDDGPSFTTCGQAGQVSANSGLNSAGFAMAMTALWWEDVWDFPIEGYFHYLAQFPESVAEAQAYLETTPRGGCMGSVNMADAAGNIRVFEGTWADYGLRDPGDAGELDPFLVQTNHYVHPDMLAYNYPGVETGGSWYRYVTAFEYAEAAAAAGAVDFEFIKAMYRSDDWYDDATDTWHYNDPAGPGVLNSFPSSVTQAILFPADLIAHFCVGTPSGIGVPVGATGEYVKLKLADDPATVTNNVKNYAFGFYRDARNLFESELNDNAPYLTYEIAQSLEEMLDEAMLEYQRGMTAGGLALLAGQEGAPVSEEVALWGEALTHYAKTQLYAQMVTTQLEDLAAP